MEEMKNMKIRFFIKDITSELLAAPRREKRPVDYIHEDGFPKTFASYEDASDFIKKLQHGYYQVEKVFLI